MAQPLGVALALALPARTRARTPTPEAERAPESGERLKEERLDDWDDPGPLSDEPQMENHLHVMAFFLLLASLRWWWRDRNDYFASGNLSIYYPVTSSTGRTLQKKLAFNGPDFFVVLDPKPKKLRNSWVVENEGGKYPDVIVELLSRSTQKNDRGKKKLIYETVFKTPEYFLFDPEKLTLEGYHLVRGRYVAIRPDARGRLWSDKLEVALGVHEGSLRLFTEKGKLVPLPDEAALDAMSRAKQHAARARQEAARAERTEVLVARLERENARLFAELQALREKTPKKKPAKQR